jgi:hypothetical protein
MTGRIGVAALVLVGSLSVVPACAATFTFWRPFEPGQDWDHEVEFSGVFTAVDRDRNGYITTHEVQSYSFGIYADFPRLSSGFRGSSTDRFSRFQIRYNLSDQTHDFLRVSQRRDGRTWFPVVRCAETRDQLPDKPYTLNTVQELSSGSAFGAGWEMSYFGNYGGNRQLCGGYDMVGESGSYATPVRLSQFGDATLAPVPVPATGALLLGALGLAGAVLRRRKR